MGAIENFRSESDEGSVDRWLDAHNARLAGWKPGEVHPLERPEMKKRHQQLVEWYQQEREKQAANRYQMAIDQDFYDNLQWDEQDVQELADRGQAALVFNVQAATVDWIIGTEKRTRVDFKVLPRNDEDLNGADLKTKALKYLSDVNKTAFARSLAFADSVKVGVGWLEDGVRGDTTEEPLFSRYESWRNLIWDSSGVERNGADWRYLYRWKWIDLDIALVMWPDRADKLRQAAVAANLFGNEDDDDFWYLGQRYQARDARGEVIGRRSYVSDTQTVNNRRARVRLIEAWYRVPERDFVMRGDVFNGQAFDKENQEHVRAALEGVVSLYDRIALKVRCAIMTESHMIQEMASPYRHNRFPFTPIWCYIRGRDRMPYGTIRRTRDIQEDLNKRASKALFLLSTNRIIADVDAIEGTGLTWDDVREEAARPDALMTVKRGSRFEFDNNIAIGEEHIKLAERDERMIQHSGGVTDDNLGRRTNAVSGEAIKARQLQGSVVTAEIFDNERFAIQHQGEMQLSNIEQFWTEPKVIRITGSKGKLDFYRLNEPEPQPDGSVRYINDITASQADFIVDEQDFHQSVRQAMFESMTDLVGKLAQVNVESALRIMRMALEFSDLPNKEEMAGEIKQMLGIVDEDEIARMSPQQKAELQQQMQMKQEQADLQRRGAYAEVAEKEAKAKKLEADAEKIHADAEHVRAEAGAIERGDGGELAAAKIEFQRKVADAERKAAEAVDAAREQMEDLAAKLRDRQSEIDTKAKTDKEIAEIQAKAKIEEAKIVQGYEAAIRELKTQLGEALSELKKVATRQEQSEQAAQKEKVEREAHAKAEKEATAVREKAEKESAATRDKERKEAEKAKAAEEPKGPLVVFEQGAIQVNGAPAVGKTISAKTRDGKEITMRIEPDGDAGKSTKKGK